MKLINRWSIRLALIGVALGFLQSYSVVTLPHFMIGFGVPFAIVLAAIGVLIDFSLAKKTPQSGGMMTGRLMSKWSIRLGLLGLAIGMAQHFFIGGADLAAMIGFSIPYAIVLSGIGLLVDFSVNNKSRNIGT